MEGKTDKLAHRPASHGEVGLFCAPASRLPVVGRLRYANGEVQEFTDPGEYIATFKEELGYRATTGMRHETLTNDPQVRKAIDDAIYDLYGEQNPQPLSDYQPPVSEGPTLTMGGM